MSSSALAFCITHTSASEHLMHLAPFAVWTAFPSADYYGASVAVGLSPRRQSRVPFMVDVQDGLGALFAPLKGLEAPGSPGACPRRVVESSWSRQCVVHRLVGTLD